MVRVLRCCTPRVSASKLGSGSKDKTLRLAKHFASFWRSESEKPLVLLVPSGTSSTCMRDRRAIYLSVTLAKAALQVQEWWIVRANCKQQLQNNTKATTAKWDYLSVVPGCDKHQARRLSDFGISKPLVAHLAFEHRNFSQDHEVI